MNKESELEKSIKTGAKIGLFSGLGYFIIFGGLGIAGAFTFSLSPILAFLILGIAGGSLYGIYKKRKP